MATITANTYPYTPSPSSRGKKGFFSRIGARVVAARMAQADRQVAAYLLTLDDATLAKLGYDRAALEARDPMGYPFL